MCANPVDRPERQPLFAARQTRMINRQQDIAASNVMDHVSNAARGIVPGVVDRRAVKPWR